MPESPDTPDRRPDEEPEPSWQVPPMPPVPPGTWTPGNWQPPAKPGIIPLRPLGLGDIYGGAIAAMHTRAGLMLGVTAIVVAVTQVLILLTTYSMLDDLSRTAATDPYADPAEALRVTGMTVLIAVIGFLFTVISRVFLSGFLTVVVGTAVLGERPSFGEVVARVRPRLLPLLGLTLVYTVVTVAAVAVVVVMGLGAPALGVLALLGVMVVGVWLWTVFSLSTPALVLEGVGIGQAFGRSRHLVRGSWWRIFGITLLAGVIVSAVAFVIALPFEALGGGFAATVPLTTEYLVLSTIGAIVAGTVTEPFVAAVTALLYTDRRMRLERLDVELTRAAG